MRRAVKGKYGLGQKLKAGKTKGNAPLITRFNERQSHIYPFIPVTIVGSPAERLLDTVAHTHWMEL